MSFLFIFAHAGDHDRAELGRGRDQRHLANIKYEDLKIKSLYFLTCERREEEGMAGRVATPPVVSAEVTRLCRLETDTASWIENN